VRIACVPARMMQDQRQDCSREISRPAQSKSLQQCCSDKSETLSVTQREVVRKGQSKSLSERPEQARAMNGRVPSGMRATSPPGRKRSGFQASGSDQVLCTAWRMGHTCVQCQRGRGKLCRPHAPCLAHGAHMRQHQRGRGRVGQAAHPLNGASGRASRRARLDGAGHVGAGGDAVAADLVVRGAAPRDHRHHRVLPQRLLRHAGEKGSIFMGRADVPPGAWPSDPPLQRHSRLPRLVFRGPSAAHCRHAAHPAAHPLHAPQARLHRARRNRAGARSSWRSCSGREAEGRSVALSAGLSGRAGAGGANRRACSAATVTTIASAAARLGCASSAPKAVQASVFTCGPCSPSQAQGGEPPLARAQPQRPLQQVQLDCNRCS